MPCKQKKNGKDKWIAQVMKDGQRKAKLFDTKKEAKAWEVAMKTAKARKATPSTSLIEWAEGYLDYSLAMHSKETFQEKRRVFKRLLKVLPPSMPTTDLTRQHVFDFLKVQAKKRSGHAVNTDRKNLNAAWTWGVENRGFLPENPCKVKKFPEVRSPRYVPPEEDFWKVYEVASEADKVLLKTFLYTAARRGEVFNMTWRDVDFTNSRIQLFTKKREGGSQGADWVAMVQELREALLWWWENRPHKEAEHVFTVCGGTPFTNQYDGDAYGTRQHFMKKLCQKAGVKPFGFHGIRHLTASILDRGGVELTAIQKTLRHMNSHTTARYLHSMRGVGEVLEAVMPKPPGKVIPINQNENREAALA